MKYIFIFFAIFLNLSININAQTYDINYEEYKGSKVEDAFFKTLNRDFCSSGQLSVISFDQSDNIWKDDIMVPNKTISAKGCALTCMAMLLHSNGQNVTPRLLNNYVIENSGYNLNGDLNWHVARRYGSSLIQYAGWDNFSLDRIKTLLHSGNPVIMMVNNTSINKHFIIITGYENEGIVPKDFTIINPAGGKVQKLSVYLVDCDSKYENLRIFSLTNAPCIITNPPAHCYNCLYEPWLGEIDIDCGGSCPPCLTTKYIVEITGNNKIIQEKEIIATGSVIINPPNNEVINLTKTKFIKSGKDVLLKGNINILPEEELSIKVTNNYNNLTKDCNAPCIFFPNYASSSDRVYKINVANIEYIDFTLFNRWGNTIKKYSEYIDYDGTVDLFSLPESGTYLFVSTLIDCSGDNIPYKGSLTIMGKEEESGYKYSNVTDSINSTDLSFNEKNLFLTDNTNQEKNNDNSYYYLYPNPSKGNITIEVLNNVQISYNLTVQNLNGIMIEKIENINSTSKRLDFSDYRKGIYILIFETSSNLEVKKLILE